MTASKHTIRLAASVRRIAQILGEHEAYVIINDRITAARRDKQAEQAEQVATQIEQWFMEPCVDNGFAGSCGCAHCLDPKVSDTLCKP